MRSTNPFEMGSLDERFVGLPVGETVLDTADASRAAALEFCTSSQFGWGRAELLAWLNGSYRDALRGAGADVSFDETALEELDDATVVRLVSRARAAVVEMIEHASTEWRGSGFEDEKIDASFVVGITDSNGGLGYAPQNRPGMRLLDRVIALFFADYLTRPRDYESLVVCSCCNEISFQWEEVHSYDCDTRRPGSGIVVKRPKSTRLGAGARRTG